MFMTLTGGKEFSYVGVFPFLCLRLVVQLNHLDKLAAPPVGGFSFM